MPCPHPRSTFYSGMERPGRNQLGLAGSYFFPKWGKMPDALSPYQIHILFGNGEAEKKPVRTKLLHEEPSTSLNLTLFTRRKTVINWRFNIRSNFPNEWKWKSRQHDDFRCTMVEQLLLLLTRTYLSKIEHKRQSIKIESPTSSWTLAQSRPIITQAIHHQPSTKNKSMIICNIIISVFVAALHLGMFLRFIFGLFLNSGRTSNQVAETRMILQAPAQLPCVHGHTLPLSPLCSSVRSSL